MSASHPTRPVHFVPLTGLGAGREIPELVGDEAHLWDVDLLAAPAESERLGSFLAEDERGRAARYHFDRHRRRFIVSQGVLRALLGRYLERHPAGIVFEYGPKGKPSLPGEPELHFNVSHSHERSVVAISAGGELGVDIERLRPLPDADDIARRFFSAREAAAYAAVPRAQRPQAFFNCWTRKEAFIKALGEGLFLALDRFDVSLVPGDPAAILRIDDDPEKARDWSLTDFRPVDGFAGALAAPFSPSAVRGWRLPLSELLRLGAE